MKGNLLLIGSFLLIFAFLVNVSAEESFFEESFLSDSMPEESFFEGSFNGNDFFAEDFLVSEENSEDIRTEEIEDRSVLAIPGEELETLSYDWQVAPEKLLAEMPKANSVKLTWEHPLAKLPTGVKFYVYEQQEDGTGIQVGVVTAKTITLKNVSGGKHTYFIRTEYVDAKKERELHGADSESSNEVNVISELWKKAPVVSAERTGINEVTLHWIPDADASFYQVKVSHAGKLVEIATGIIDGTYIDTSAVIGKNAYEVYAYHSGTNKNGKASKTIVTLSDEAWKTAPVIRKVEQLNASTAKVGFFHVSMAEQYEIAIGSQKKTVNASKADYDAETGCLLYEVPFKGASKQKVTVQPLGTNDKGKIVKGTKSAAVTLVSLQDTLLGAMNVKAVADGSTVTVSWKNGNKNTTEECRVYLFNSGTKKVVKDTRSPYGMESSCEFSDLENGIYKVFVRIFTVKDSKDSPITDEMLYDTVNLSMPEVTVTGISMSDLKVTGISQTSLTLYEQTNPTITLGAKNEKGYSLIWNSSDSSVATVENGVVKAVSGGTCYISVKAMATCGALTVYGTPVSCKVTVNPAIYRAVVIAQRYPHYNYSYYYSHGWKLKKSLDAGIRFNNDRLYIEGLLKKTGYSTVKTAVDIDKNKTLALIKETFKDADSNDVSLVFFSCHGVTDEEYVNLTDYGRYYYSGDLCFTKGNNLTPMELAVRLDEDIPAGRVVVLLGSCGSGAMITPNGVASRGTSEPWGQAFIDAFKALHPEDQEDDLISRYDELTIFDQASTTKSYYVMTAAERWESSNGYENGSAHAYNYFATWVGESAGYQRGGIWEDVPNMYGYVRFRKGKASSGTLSSAIPGDANRDKNVSFLECYDYVYNQKYYTVIGQALAEDDTPLKYSSGQDFPLFRR